MPKELIPIVLFIGVFALLFSLRYFTNKERLAMIERGLSPILQNATPKPFVSLRYGLLFIGVGVGLFFATVICSVFFDPNLDGDSGREVALYFGSVLFFGGIGLVISYVVEKKWLDKQ